MLITTRVRKDSEVVLGNSITVDVILGGVATSVVLEEVSII